MPNDNGRTPRRGGPLPLRAKHGARGPRAPAPGAPPTPPVVPQELSLIAPPPEQLFRALQEVIRLGIWDYASDIGYNPWQAMIAMALAQNTPLDLKLDCHKEVAAYLLSKLASIKVEGEVAHLHASTSLRELMEVWEREEAEAKANLPPWTPPGTGGQAHALQTDRKARRTP